MKSHYLPSLFLSISFLFLQVFSQSPIYDSSIVTCPSFSCSDYLGSNVCYLHSGGPPVKYIKLSKCPSGSRCNLEPDWAFFEMKDQNLLYSTNPHDAINFKKITQSECETMDYFRNNLYAGRLCESNYEC